ncbi:MAG: hypothetical protein LJE70_03290, partial [Chromatiaceae bacterium]|nr:hypothetical protein [Chromatiaceae bacterium]
MLPAATHHGDVHVPADTAKIFGTSKPLGEMRDFKRSHIALYSRKEATARVAPVPAYPLSLSAAGIREHNGYCTLRNILPRII